MSEPGTPAVVQFRPPHGPTFASEGECLLGMVSRDLCKIASFLQGFSPFSKLTRYEDWHDQDGLYFERGLIDV